MNLRETEIKSLLLGYIIMLREKEHNKTPARGHIKTYVTLHHEMSRNVPSLLLQ